MVDPMKTIRSRAAAPSRHLPPNKKKALELSAHAEHETGRRKERLIREAARKAA